jgi:hypothetical protein
MIKTMHIVLCTALMTAGAWTIDALAKQKAGFVSNSEQGAYTSWDAGWKFAKAGTGTFIFKAKASNDIHVALSDAAQTKDPMYEIVIGGWGNSRSVIRRKSQGPELASEDKGIANPEQAAFYWVKVDAAAKNISAGYGKKPGENKIIEYTDPNFLGAVQYYAFSSWDSIIEYSEVGAPVGR